MRVVERDSPSRRGRRIWTTRRKLVGNLAPLVLGAYPCGLGIARLVADPSHSTRAIWPLLLGVVLMWIGANFLALLGNARMRRALELRLRADGRGAPPGSAFVGCATPGYAGWLDPHEDVGFLSLLPDRLIFTGDSLDLVMVKTDVLRVGHRPNIHTMVGLGRWVTVDGISAGTKVRLSVEPRERPTLLGNLAESGRLTQRINDWLTQDQAQA